MDENLIPWVHAAQGGDREALQALIAAMYPAYSQYLRRRVWDSPLEDDVVDDLAQEVSVRIVLHLTDFHGSSSRELHGWALSIARNALLDELRRRRRERLAWQRDPVLRGNAVDALPDSDAPASPGLHAAAVAAYGRLPEVTCEILWMRLMEGATWEEIGDALHLASRSATKRRAERALRRIARDLSRGAAVQA